MFFWDNYEIFPRWWHEIHANFVTPSLGGMKYMPTFGGMKYMPTLSVCPSPMCANFWWHEIHANFVIVVA